MPHAGVAPGGWGSWHLARAFVSRLDSCFLDTLSMAADLATQLNALSSIYIALTRHMSAATSYLRDTNKIDVELVYLRIYGNRCNPSIRARDLVAVRIIGWHMHSCMGSPRDGLCIEPNQ